MEKKEIIDEVLTRRICNGKSFAKMFPKEYGEMRKIEFPKDFKFSQKLYHYLNCDDNLELGLCPECGSRCGYINLKRGYHTYCSSKCATSSNVVQEKMKATCLEKYGAENPTKNNDIRERIKNTNIEKYGVDNPMKSDLVKERVIQNTLEKYGVEHTTQLESVKEKIKQTNLGKYGCECVFGSDVIKDKIKQTNLEKYGSEYIGGSEEIRKKIEEHNFEKYGVKCTLELDCIKEKSKKTNLEKYGVEHPAQSEAIQSKAKRTNNMKYGVDFPLSSKEVREKIRKTTLDRYGVEWACMRTEARNYSNDSKPNRAFAELLSERGVQFDREFPLGKYSYDFRIGDTLVEINPTITHNSFLSVFGDAPKSNDYHCQKSKTASKNGYKCVHIWDWDDVGKVVAMFLEKTTLHARRLNVCVVGTNIADAFFNENHIQGTCRGKSLCVGLYDNGTLVMCMAFGKPRYNRNYEFELLRLCTKQGYAVVGGAERLFKFALDGLECSSVISYCDCSKFSGDVYERLGFKKVRISKPTKHWFRMSDRCHVTDNLLRQRGFDQLFNANYGKGTSNEELMLENGFLPVYDCGQDIWSYER